MRKMAILLLLLLFVLCASLFISKKIHAPTQLSNLSDTNQNLHLAILPHHDLLIDYFPAFYSQLVDDSNGVQHVILLSPNHFHSDFQSIATIDQNIWSETNEDILIDTPYANSFLQRGLVLVENQFFMNEHGVIIHIPFIRQYFPQAKISAFLFTRNVSKKVLDNFAKNVLEIAGKEKTLILVSSDFSHYLSLEEAEMNDQKSLTLLQQKNADEIYHLSDDYVDCSACLYVLTKLSDDLHYDSLKVIFHSNSVVIQQAQHIQETTSYFVLRFEE